MLNIGLDFDNTIVCYDDAVRELAIRDFDVPTNACMNKISIRKYLRDNRGEDVWVSFQGSLYGPGMRYAKPYPGCIGALTELRAKGVHLSIISHRSKWPYSGDAYDLHAFASDWISNHLDMDLFDSSSNRDIYFLETKEEKVSKIKDSECDIFVDDLLDLLEMLSFPNKPKRILFDPHKKFIDKKDSKLSVASSWSEIVEIANLLLDF